MAQRTRIRRKARRGRPAVRRTAQGSTSRLAGRQGGGLMIGGAQDPAERAADRTADRVMAMRSPVVHRKDQGEQRDDDKKVKRATEEPEPDDRVRASPSPKAAPVAPGAGAAPASAGAASAIGQLGGGRPMASAERAFFEPRMGADLGDVRIHDDHVADSASQAIHARAFTLGNDIAFARDQYQPGAESGRRLLAHELAHVVDTSGTVRRDDADPPPPPTKVTLNFSGALPAGQAGATTPKASADVAGVKWSIVNGSATKAAGTSIAADGTITVDPKQAGGTLTVRADNAGGFATETMWVTSIPTGVSATAFSSNLSAATTDYGAAFQNTFISKDGVAASLEGVRVGERFPGAPTPTAATHAFSGAASPFGARDTFTLSTGTLAADAAGAWALDSSAQFGPPPAGATVQQGDNLSTAKSLINVGNHIASASNPTPVGPLPVTMTLDQDLHWFNPLAAAASRWTKFTTLAHSRTLRSDGTSVEFVTTLNGVEQAETYEGPTAVFGLNAAPASTPKSDAAPPGGKAPAARTVALAVQSLPTSLRSGETLGWSIVGEALGCTVTPDTTDSKKASLTVGTTAGSVTIEVKDMDNKNKARVRIRIT